MNEESKMAKDRDAFQERIQELREHDVSSTTYDDFQKLIKHEFDSVQAFRKTLALNIAELRNEANDHLLRGKKENYPEDNPYFVAANLLVKAMNSLIDQTEWGDLQTDLLLMERKKLYSLINKLVKLNAQVEILKAEKERDKQAFDEIKSWLKEQKDDLKAERNRLIENNFIPKMEFEKLVSKVEELEKQINEVKREENIETNKTTNEIKDITQKVSIIKEELDKQNEIKAEPKEIIVDQNNMNGKYDITKKILQCIREKPGLNSKEISKEIEEDKKEVTKALKKLKIKGIIKNDGDIWWTI